MGYNVSSKIDTVSGDNGQRVVYRDKIVEKIVEKIKIVKSVITKEVVKPPVAMSKLATKIALSKHPNFKFDNEPEELDLEFYDQLYC